MMIMRYQNPIIERRLKLERNKLTLEGCVSHFLLLPERPAMKQSSMRMIFVCVVLSITILGCKEDDPTQPSAGDFEALISHFGFDFSAGIMDSVTFSNNDGETIGWMPGGSTNPAYPGYGSYVWFRTSNNSTINETKDMGIIDLSSVTSVPDAWDASPNIPPLLLNHVIVAACKDGYVKFKVLSVDTSGFWAARIKYVFSSTTSFPN
jgi:hypothetical protein